MQRPLWSFFHSVRKRPPPCPNEHQHRHGNPDTQFLSLACSPSQTGTLLTKALREFCCVPVCIVLLQPMSENYLFCCREENAFERNPKYLSLGGFQQLLWVSCQVSISWKDTFCKCPFVAILLSEGIREIVSFANAHQTGIKPQKIFCSLMWVFSPFRNNMDISEIDWDTTGVSVFHIYFGSKVVSAVSGVSRSTLQHGEANDATIFGQFRWVIVTPSHCTLEHQSKCWHLCSRQQTTTKTKAKKKQSVDRQWI